MPPTAGATAGRPANGPAKQQTYSWPSTLKAHPNEEAAQAQKADALHLEKENHWSETRGPATYHDM